MCRVEILACPLMPYTGCCWYASFHHPWPTVSPWRRQPMSTAPHKAHDTTTERVLCGAFALSETTTCSRMPTKMTFQAVFMRGGRRPRLVAYLRLADK